MRQEHPPRCLLPLLLLQASSFFKFLEILLLLFVRGPASSDDTTSSASASFVLSFAQPPHSDATTPPLNFLFCTHGGQQRGANVAAPPCSAPDHFQSTLPYSDTADTRLRRPSDPFQLLLVIPRARRLTLENPDVDYSFARPPPSSILSPSHATRIEAELMLNLKPDASIIARHCATPSTPRPAHKLESPTSARPSTATITSCSASDYEPQPPKAP